MLWLGGALDTTGLVVNRVSSQIDVTTTLEKQIEPSAALFPFSKNIFDSTQRSWAYFSFNDGFGFVQPGKAVVYDNIGRRMVYKTRGTSEKDIDAGKAFQQFIFQDYLNK